MIDTIKDKTTSLRRQHVREAAIRTFSQRGFHRTTIRDIAIEAGISDGAIYNLFENKMALLLSVLEPLGEGDASPAFPDQVDDVQSFITLLLQRRWETFTPEMLKILRIVFSESLTNEELRLVYMDQVITPVLIISGPLFKVLADAKRISTDDVSMLLRSMTAMVLGLVVLRFLGDKETERNWEAFPKHLSALFTQGLIPRDAKDTDDG